MRLQNKFQQKKHIFVHQYLPRQFQAMSFYLAPRLLSKKNLKAALRISVQSLLSTKEYLAVDFFKVLQEWRQLFWR
jgi:hypothetical protein